MIWKMMLCTVILPITYITSVCVVVVVVGGGVGGATLKLVQVLYYNY